jgi:hypothetical protein
MFLFFVCREQRLLGWEFGGEVIGGGREGMLFSYLYWLYNVSDIGLLLFVCMSFN